MLLPRHCVIISLVLDLQYMVVKFEGRSNFNVKAPDDIASFEQIKGWTIDFVIFEDIGMSGKNISEIFIDLVGRPFGSIDNACILITADGSLLG